MKEKWLYSFVNMDWLKQNKRGGASLICIYIRTLRSWEYVGME